MIATFEIKSNCLFFREEWVKRHSDSMSRALKAVSFQILKAERERLKKGVEPARAPMTAAIAVKRGKKALAAFANMPAYEVNDAALSAKIGFSASGSRRSRPLPLELIQQVLAGREIDVNERVRVAIALKAKRRGVSAKRLSKIVPHDGERLTVPTRDVMALVGGEALPKAQGWLQALYNRAMNGERWSNDWLGEL